MGSSEILEADYLVIGSGAMGMAFVDVLVSESNASVVIVDRRDRPGGHWNDAYSFLRLHSASAYYGVSSTALGRNQIEQLGANKGFYERASAPEICAYFDRIMRERFLPTGRVSYFPNSDYRGQGRFVSLVSGVERRVIARKIVDATFTDTAVPSRHTRPFHVGEGVQCIAPNALPDAASADRYVVLGAGKTGMDVSQWLLDRGVSPDLITWIMPRDSWLLDRKYYEPGARGASWTLRMHGLIRQTEIIREARSLSHLFEMLESDGHLLRLNAKVTPTRYRCATVSQHELEQLRRIDNVIRMGHVVGIERDRIVLERGTVATSAHTLHIDCTASGIRSRTPVPVFVGNSITLQPIRTCQQCFSSGLIAHIDLTYADDAEKNALCRPIPLPIRDVDWLTMFAMNLMNQGQWMNTPHIRNWISQTRLDLNYGRVAPFTPEEGELLQQFRAGAAAAVQKIPQLLSAATSAPTERSIEPTPVM